jgi:hypothetical protein
MYSVYFNLFFFIPGCVQLFDFIGAHVIMFHIITVQNAQAWLLFTLSFHIMHVNVLTLFQCLCLFIFSGTIHLCSVYFHGRCKDILSLLYCFRYAFHLNPTGVILLWPMEEWLWFFTCMNFMVTVIIIFLHHNTHPPLSTMCACNVAVQGNVVVCNMVRSCVLP